MSFSKKAKSGHQKRKERQEKEKKQNEGKRFVTDFFSKKVSETVTSGSGVATDPSSSSSDLRQGRKIKAGNTSAEKLPVYEPNIPEPTSREELLKYWLNISLDERTANKVLWLTEGGAKVCRMTEEVCPYLHRPERFDYSPQVLCKESVWASRCYWEVLYSGWVVIGAAYEGAGRKAGDGPCGLGENEESWGLGWAGSCYDAWYKGTSSRVTDVPQCCTIGVYVDQPAGLLCFYAVETEEDSKKKEVKLLHRFKNPIKEKILPGFWVGRQSSCLILKKEE